MFWREEEKLTDGTLQENRVTKKKAGGKGMNVI